MNFRGRVATAAQTEGHEMTAPQADLASKRPTSLHTGLRDYIAEQTGVEVDTETVSLVVRALPRYRSSEENQARRTAARLARAAGSLSVEERKRQRALAKAAKLRAAAEELERAVSAEGNAEVFIETDHLEVPDEAAVIELPKPKKAKKSKSKKAEPEVAPTIIVDEAVDGFSEEPETAELSVTETPDVTPLFQALPEYGGDDDDDDDF